MARTDQLPLLAIAAMAAILAALTGFALADQPSWLTAVVPAIGPLQVIGLFALVAAFVASARNPRIGVILLVVLLYTNASEVAVRFHGLPSPLMLIVAATLAGIIAERWRSGDRQVVLDPLLIPLAIYGLVLFGTSIGASNLGAADAKLFEFAKALVVFMLMANTLTGRHELRQLGWALILSGAFLGTISLYQVLTHSYDGDLGGFGRVKLAQIVGETREPRIAGSLSDPNFYAQILAMLVPIALYSLWEEDRFRLKALAGYALAVIALAAVFTYSRGGALAMGVVLVFALLHKRISPRYLLLGIAVLAPLWLVVPQSFEGRLTTLTQLTEQSDDGSNGAEDSSFRQRRILMTVAWREFLDHPLTGVGAGNYTEHFDGYADAIGSTQRSFDKFNLQHFPHSLPLEILAETGLAGMAAFVAIIAAAMFAARSAYRAFLRGDDRHSANLVFSVALGIIAFLTTSVFLHGAYIQYLWLLIAFVATARQIALREPAAQAAESNWIWQVFERRERLARQPAPVRPATVQLSGLTAASPPAETAPQIAYVMSRFPLLTETFILREMLELERSGMRLMVFPLLRENAPVRHAEVERLRARVWYTPFLSWPIVAANLHFLLRRPARYLGALGAALRGNWGSANLFFGAVGIFPKSVYLARLVETEGIRHIHAHYATHPALAALIASRLTGVRFSFTVHAHDIFIHQQMLAEKARQAHFIAAISDYNKRFILDRTPGLSPDRIAVIHCGIEPDSYARLAERRGADAGGTLTALCVASLQPYKGIKHLIQATTLVREQVPGFRCLVAGEGADRPELEALIADLGLADCFKLLGARPQHEVSVLLEQADLFVLPSVIAPSGQMEGIPVALMEAMASRLPVIATQISGIPELVEHGRNGLLVEPGDETALASALLALLHDPALRARMGIEGSRKVAAEFDLQGNAALLRSRFERAMQGADDLDEDLIGWLEDRVTDRGGPGTALAIRRAGGGRDSRIYEVSAVSGQTPHRATILKLHRPHWARPEDATREGEPFARREYQALDRLGGIFANLGPVLGVPRPLDFNPNQAALLMDKVPGDKLSLAMRWAWARPQARADLRGWFTGCGEWLAIWHGASVGAPGDGSVIQRMQAELEQELTLCLKRGLDKKAARTIHARFLSEQDGLLARQPIVAMHCDFAPYNVLAAPGTTTVIDFEGVRPGLPLEDLTYFLGMLEATPFYHLGSRMAADLKDRFLEGYERHRPVDRAALDFFMLLATIKIMGRSPVLRPGGSLFDRIKRWQRLRFYRNVLTGRLA
ncbi:MAG: glycosyltransferase [Novosphingobium sp.]